MAPGGRARPTDLVARRGRVGIVEPAEDSGGSGDSYPHVEPPEAPRRGN